MEWKIERRVLERIGHVMRMENDRLPKAVVLGWWEGLEGRGKMAVGRGRLYCTGGGVKGGRDRLDGGGTFDE